MHATMRIGLLTEGKRIRKSSQVKSSQVNEGCTLMVYEDNGAQNDALASWLAPSFA